MSIKVTAETIKLIILVGLLAVLGWLVWDYFDTKHENKELTGTVQQQDRTAAATTAIAEDLGTAMEGASQEAAYIASNRAASVQRYEELRRENTTVRDWSAARIPDELRQLACERRLARERSGGAASGSRGIDPGAPACRFHPER